MEGNIYRSAALEKLSRPEQLDQMVRVTGPLGWLALLAVGVVLAAAVAWAIFGKIATTVTGSGVVMRHGGYRVVASAHPGELVGFHAQLGDIVSAGEVVARVRQYSPEYSPYIEQSVVSRWPGQVLEVMANDGDILQVGRPLLTVEPVQEPLEAVVYVPLKQAKLVRPGTAVRLSPSTALREEFGYLCGTVRSVGDFAATQAGMTHILNNDGLVDALRADGPPVMIVIDLLPDRSTPSGYKWSSSMGPPGPILSGTFCSANVTVREDAPIRLVIPKLRTLTGLYQ